MIGFLFMIVLVLGVLWAVGAMRATARTKGKSRLNNQGLPRPYTRDDHEQNDEE